MTLKKFQGKKILLFFIISLIFIPLIFLSKSQEPAETRTKADNPDKPLTIVITANLPDLIFKKEDGFTEVIYGLQWCKNANQPGFECQKIKKTVSRLNEEKLGERKIAIDPPKQNDPVYLQAFLIINPASDYTSASPIFYSGKELLPKDNTRLVILLREPQASKTHKKATHLCSI